MFVIPHRPRLHATTLRRVGVADAGVHRSNRSPRQIGTERQLSSTHPNFRSLEPRAPTPTVVTATTGCRGGHRPEGAAVAEPSAIRDALQIDATEVSRLGARLAAQQDSSLHPSFAHVAQVVVGIQGLEM